MTVQTTGTVLVREVVREAIGHVAETRGWCEGERPYAEPEIVAAIADRVAAQLDAREHCGGVVRRADLEQSAATTKRVRAVVWEVAMWVLARFEEQGKLNADPVAVSIADRVADRVTTQLEPLYARIAALETGLREACTHIDALHLLDLDLHAESIRLRALAGKP